MNWVQYIPAGFALTVCVIAAFGLARAIRIKRRADRRLAELYAQRAAKAAEPEAPVPAE